MGQREGSPAGGMAWGGEMEPESSSYARSSPPFLGHADPIQAAWTGAC